MYRNCGLIGQQQCQLPISELSAELLSDNYLHIRYFCRSPSSRQSDGRMSQIFSSVKTCSLIAMN